MRILFVDNYDSFVYNIVQYFGRITKDIKVVRNDEVTVSEIVSYRPDGIVISPGPGTPDKAGRSMEIIKAVAGKTPILGVCLGHQAIGRVFGAKVVRARKIVHGKTSLIQHNGKGIFLGVKNPFTATRYHSLIIEKALPPLEITARTKDNEIMGVRVKGMDIYGVQFHPESILTPEGFKIIENFCRIADK
ncbi:MAG: anthranilate/aminodeoxychorismate synthase component II [Elusimicrobia bacterium HGW-Elusimicrobia-2]|nr:MAG: anthranilate/aminodeoxychorismate synthase component II [Elusimicrobia bacterium HGW-Elusimicrobia-2]